MSSIPPPPGWERPPVVDVPARVLTVEKRTGEPDVQRFDAAAINSAIDRQMKALPAGKVVAAIAYVDRYGANIALVGKLPKVPGQAEWTVMATKQWSGDWQASAAVRWSI